MKYRSPSPQSALPTPPHSPRTTEASHSAVILLESLNAFYQQERYWVHHTRAALELALTKGIDAPPSKAADAPSSIQDPLSPTTTLVESPRDSADDLATVKLEPDSPLSSMSAEQRTKWMRRKNIMQLKLDGITSHSKRRRPHRAPPTEPAARLLEMFSELVDARMESCQRISRLVHDANRPAIYMC